MCNDMSMMFMNANIEVTFNPQTGLPLDYRRRADGGGFNGAASHESIMTRVCKVFPRSYANAPAVLKSVSKGMSCISFSFDALYDGIRAASFEIRYLLGKSSVTVSMEEVREYEGFEFIEAEMPCLASITETEDEGAWLAHCNNLGNVVSLKDAKPGELPEHPYFGKIMCVLPVVMLGSSKAVCVMEVTAYNDGTTLRVEESNSTKRASIGTVKTYRVDGSSWCNSNDDNLTRIYGNENTPNLPVGQKSSCRLDFAGDYDKNGRVDWVDGAKIVHERMPKLRTDYYDDKLIYFAGCDHPQLDMPKNSFIQAGQFIKDIAGLVDFNPQVVYLVGWYSDGMDTGYPSVTEGYRLGGHEAYLKLKRDAEDINCNVGLHDNYDDAYEDSPAWDTSNIARLPDGSLWKSRAWTRDPSYVQGLAKYMEGPGVDRIQYTCEHYELRDTTHIDVLSWYAIRNDWDMEKPASGIRNLYEGRFKILDEYAKRGIDVTSEALRYPMVGRLSMCVHTEDEPCVFGGDPVPITPLIYKNAIMHGRGRKENGTWLLYNMHNTHWFQWSGRDRDTEINDILDMFYLKCIPWYKLNKLEMIDYVRKGNVEMLTIENNSTVTVNIAEGTYSAIWNGTEITRDSSVYCPLDEERIAFYSIEDKILNYPVPGEWAGMEIKARELFADRSEPYNITVFGGNIYVSAKSRRPIIVYIDR